jgi:hypothetical protein
MPAVAVMLPRIMSGLVKATLKKSSFEARIAGSPHCRI